MGKRLRRIDICTQLKLGNRQSYRIVPPSYGPLINSDEVLHIINQARRGIQEALDGPPLDMMTAEEISKIVLDGLIPSKRILTWTHRTKNVPPHFRFNKKTTRFSRHLFEEWITERSHIRWPN